MNELKPVVFLDRDGTINYDAGYINDIDNFIMYPYAAQAVRMLNINGFLVVVILLHIPILPQIWCSVSPSFFNYFVFCLAYQLH